MHASGNSTMLLLAGLGILGGTVFLLTRKETVPPSTTPPQTQTTVKVLSPSAISAAAQVYASPPPAAVQEASFVPATPPPPPALDTGLTPQEASAIAYALARETSPQNLVSFAATLTDAPMAASLLRSRAASLGVSVS